MLMSGRINDRKSNLRSVLPVRLGTGLLLLCAALYNDSVWLLALVHVTGLQHICMMR